MSIKKEIIKIIKESLDKLNIDISESDIIIDIPKNANNGDYSTNIALLLTKKLHENPEQ